jgi:hypothetical protein
MYAITVGVHSAGVCEDGCASDSRYDVVMQLGRLRFSNLLSLLLATHGCQLQ